MSQSHALLLYLAARLAERFDARMVGVAGRERVVGGVTRALVAQQRIAVALSH